eukprot:scaffold124549_cov43-Prasinocladus_malaysianus.AAC.1
MAVASSEDIASNQWGSDATFVSCAFERNLTMHWSSPSNLSLYNTRVLDLPASSSQKNGEDPDD